MVMEAIRPVIIKTSIIADIILVRRLMLVMEATAEDREKKTRGVIAVKRRLRKISPKGLKIAASFLKIIPRNDPIMIDITRIIENP